MIRLLLVFIFLDSMGCFGSDDPVLMRINGKEVLRSEFERSYNKDSGAVGAGRRALEAYVNKFIDQAENRCCRSCGVGHFPYLSEELDEYRCCLIKSYRRMRRRQSR